jgi:hypothetical protein
VPDLHAADRRRLHVVKLLAPLLLRLAAARRTPAGPAEGTLGTAAATTAARTRRAAAGSGAGSAATGTTTAAGTRTAATTGPAATAAATGPGARSGTRAAAACAGTAPAHAGRRGARGHVHRARPGTAGTRTAIGRAGTLGPAGTASARTGPAGGAAGRTGTAFPAWRARALGPRRRRGTHPGRGRAERVVTGPGAGTRGTGTRTRGTGPGRAGTGSTRSLRPGRGRPGALTALILTASGGAGALAAVGIARRAWRVRARRRGAGAARPLAAARAAEVGRGGWGARRPGHSRGAGPLLRPRLGRPGDRRGRDRRQLPGRRVSRIRCRRGAGRRGTIRRSRPLRRTVGRPVGYGPGGRSGSGHGVGGTLRCRHRASARPRPGTVRGRAVARCGLAARPGPGTLTALGGLIRSLSRKCFLEPPDHGRLDRRGRRPYELAHFLELVHDGLALDTELFREFVNPDLRHYAPSRPSPLGPLPDPGPGRACSGPASAYGDHRRVLIERSSASRPAFRQVFLLALKPAAQPGCSAAVMLFTGIVRRKGTQPVVRG